MLNVRASSRAGSVPQGFVVDAESVFAAAPVGVSLSGRRIVAKAVYQARFIARPPRRDATPAIAEVAGEKG